MFLLLVVIAASLLAPPPDTSKAFSVTVHGFPLAPVHKSITVSAQATGKGSLAPTTATGIITFYNGQPYTQIIPVGTILTGRDGMAVITDEHAVIPPAAQTTPPTYGQVNVAAHALTPGASGNISAGDINKACCVTSVIAQNPYSFTGGRDAQSYIYVTKQDVDNAVSPLLTTLEAQTPQLFPSLALSPNCVATITATPALEQRAAKVSVTATVPVGNFIHPPKRAKRYSRLQFALWTRNLKHYCLSGHSHRQTKPYHLFCHGNVEAFCSASLVVRKIKQ